MDPDELTQALENAVNPLHEHALIASALLAQSRLMRAGEDQPAWGEEEAWASASLQRRLHYEAVRETARHFPDKEFEPVFRRDFAGRNGGIDLVFRNRADGRLVIVEARGTIRPIRNSPLVYLRATKGKGRQLSWAWIWASVAEMCYQDTSAEAFFLVLRPLLGNHASRLLSVVRFSAGAADALTPSDFRLFDEAALGGLTELADIDVLENKKFWLHEFDEDGGLTLEELYLTAQGAETGWAG